MKWMSQGNYFHFRFNFSKTVSVCGACIHALVCCWKGVTNQHWMAKLMMRDAVCVHNLQFLYVFNTLFLCSFRHVVRYRVAKPVCHHWPKRRRGNYEGPPACIAQAEKHGHDFLTSFHYYFSTLKCTVSLNEYWNHQDLHILPNTCLAFSWFEEVA
jgi:hypothetical protein